MAHWGMTILTEKVGVERVLGRYQREHRGLVGLTESISCLKTVSEEHGGTWAEVLLSREDALAVRLPDHNHDASVKLHECGLSVSVAAPRFKDAVLGDESAECLGQIRSHKNCDFSQTCLFLRYRGDNLEHIDGLHRLLAYVIYEHTEQIPAFVAGLPPTGTVTPQPRP